MSYLSRRVPLRAAGATLLALSLTACGSGGNGTIPSAGPQAAAPARPAARHKVRLRIVIPKHGHHRTRLHGHYVSAATQSITIAVTPNSGPVQNFNADLTPASNPGCKASLVSSTICTVTLTLAVGDYTATFATYDGLLAGGNGASHAPTGNQLSYNQSVPLHVVKGQESNVNVTLDGVPTSVALVPAASSTLSGNTAKGFSANKCGGATATTERVSVLGMDADDNFIIGAGAPDVTLLSDNPGVVAVSTPAPNAPNLFVLTHALSQNAQGPVNLTATAVLPTGANGSTPSVQFPVTIEGGTNVCGVFTEYALPQGVAPNPYGHLPVGITAGPDGKMWFTETQRNDGGGSGPAQIGTIANDGTVTEYADPLCNGSVTGGNAEPQSITAGGDGTLWYADLGCNRIGQITTTGTITNYSWPYGGTVYPYGVSNGPQGNMGGGSYIWVAASNAATSGGDVAYLLTNGSFYGNPFTSPLSSAPYSIAAGPDGNAWITEFNGAHVAQITPTGTITEFSGPTACFAYGFCPSGITAGPDGAMWFTDYYGAKIGRITTDGTLTETPVDANPSAITVGPDGALWFAECSPNGIGRITTDGTVTHFTIPTANTATRGIATGSDGSIWFTEYTGVGIGRLQ